MCARPPHFYANNLYPYDYLNAFFVFLNEHFCKSRDVGWGKGGNGNATHDKRKTELCQLIVSVRYI